MKEKEGQGNRFFTFLNDIMLENYLQKFKFVFNRQNAKGPKKHLQEATKLISSAIILL
jgi:hypothetical protein